MTKLVPLLAIMALLMGLPSVAHAQATTPTVSSAAITSNPGADNTYATGNTVTVSLTFSEAVTITGTPHVVVDIGGQPRNFKYSGDGSSAAAQPFSYTVLVGDKDADGVSLQANSLTLNGGTVQATDDSTNATLTHAAMTFANHKVDTQVTLLSNLGQADASDTITVSATESAKIEIVVAQDKAFDINAITLDVRTPSETLNVTVRLFGGDFADYTYTGSVTAAGLQTFTLSGPPGVSFGNVGWADFGQTYRYQMIVSGSGAGSVELVGTTGTGTDAGGVSGLSIRAVRGETSNPQMRLSGHEGAIPNLMYGDVLSSPPDGTAYAAGDRIAFLFVFSRPVDFPQGITVPFWLGNGAEDRREASLIENLSGYYEDLFFSYTVQPGDTDSDGIFLGADPLGDNAGIDFHTEETAAVPAYLRLAANQLAASQSVNGSGSRTCEEVFCSTVLVGEERVGLEAAIGFSISVNANALPFVPLGASSALSFGYGGEEYVVRELVFLDQAIAALDLRFQNGLPSSHYDRLTLSVDGTLFLLSEASSSSVAVRFQWSDPVLPWAAGDEIDVKLIETATATFDAASYAKTEGDTFEVTVTLGDPFANTLTLPIEVAENGGADATDYTGIPENLVFAPGETVKTFTVTIEDDDFNDDDESLTLSFGEESHIRSGGANETATITITDTDGPQVSVSFGAGTYTVPEGGTQSVTVSLSADPERTVEIRLTHMPQGGAGSTDYSGVPANLTFNAGETEKSFIFTSAQDMEDDDDESVLLGFGTPLPPGVTAGTTSQTTVSITDDDVPQVTVMFLESAYNVPEGGTQSVTVSLSADPERTVEIRLTHMPQGGAGSTDYSGVPTSVTFNAGETEKSFIFTSAQDMEDDDDESVLLGFGTLPSMVSAGTPATTTVSITDNDFPEVTVMFGADAYTVPEGGTQSVAVTLSADPERTVVIPLTTMPQGGAGSTDYTVPLSVTFNTGDTEQTITFSATHDTEDDDDESVLLGFGANLPIRITQGVANEATVSITDDDDPQVTVSFGAGTYTVPEGGTQLVTVNLSADPERTVVIPLTTMPQGGAGSTDYSVPLSVTFNTGEMSKTITFNATHDTEDDDDESVLLAFGANLPSRVIQGAPNEATVRITDDDDPEVTVMFLESAYNVPEGGTQSVTVNLSADPERTVVIPLTTMNQGGVDATDYSVPTSVTFNAGETEKSFIFTSAQDMEDDDDESVLLGFGTLPSMVSAGTPATTTVSITDNDFPEVTVMFGADAYTVPEGGTQSVAVTLSADPERTVVIPLTTMPQGGAGSTDYSGVPANLTFNAGETEKSFVFTSAQDTEDDDDESVLLGFGANLPIRITQGVTNEATVSITDDDDPQVSVSFGAGTYTVPEGGTQSVTVSLSADPERTVEIRLTHMPQGGAGSTDYSGVPANLTFNAGETEKSFIFTSAQDMEDDDDESVLLGFGTPLPPGVTAGTTSQTTVSITDDDVPQVTVMFLESAYNVPEGGTQSVTVSLSADPERTVEIRLTHMPQGGAGSTDYSGVPTSVTFNAGETEKSFIFTSAQDMEDDDDESVLLGFGTLPSMVSAGTPATTTVSITDNDFPEVTVMFGADAYTVPEGGTQSVAVTLSADPERTVVIPLTTMPQGGAGSTDYSGVPANLTFNAGETEKSFVFTSAQDTEDDDDESVLLGFGANLPIRITQGVANEATVSITDDDDPQVTVSFGAGTYTVPEGGTQSVTVSLSADPERTVVIPLTTMPQGGAGSTDYSVPLSVTFNSGELSKTITFSATHDTVDDDNESVLLAFGANLPSRVIQGAPNEATVRITDDDDPEVTVMFAQMAYTVPEGGTQSVTVNLSADPERTVVIPLTTMNQGGVDATDYSVPTSVTFNSGQMSKTIMFSATHDTVDDDDESVKMAIGTPLPSRVTQGAPNEATVTITDDDDPFVEVQFAQNSYTVPEGGMQAVTVTLSADPERTVDIPLVATAQGGADITDYSVPLSVTFNSGELSKTITFSATHDTVDDDNESVLLGFGANLPIRITQGVTNEATVSITDDDDPHVTVMFAQAGYRVVEGETVAVRVTLNAHPERTVTIPLVATGQVGATDDDYSGVPEDITINAGETSKTFEFMATADETSDTGESVKISFGTSLPSRVTEGTPNEATVTIKQVSTQFSLDCAGTATAWCADVGFSDQTAENWGRANLRYGRGLDPEASLSDDVFRFRGVDYTVLSVELRPGTHPIMPNAWSRWQQGYSSFRIVINWGPSLRGDPPEEHYRDWVLHLDGLELPFKDAFVYRNNFTWVGAEFQQIFNDWTPSTVTKVGIEEVAVADQDTNPLLPWAPMQVDATPEGPNGLRIDWAKPAWYTPGLNLPGLPEPTKYIVQWKLASVGWGDSADVSQREMAAGSNFHSLTVDGLTEDALYSVRVIAGNDAGDGPPSEETLGRPQDGVIALLAKTVNGRTLTLRFSERLDPNAVPAETDFVVIVDGGLIAVDSVAISGDAVTLTLDRAVTAANSVLARYDKPTDPSAVFLRDTGGDHVQISQHLELLSAVNATPQSSVQPLTAQFTNMPSSHDGATRFTFEIEFSEPVWVGIGLPRDDMLEVTGGTVISAAWKDRRTDKVTVHVRPDTTGDIVIALPGNRVCSGIIGSGDPQVDPVAGAPCAIGSRMLTNDSTMTIPGPSSSGQQVVENTPAEGEPRIDGIPEVGQTLSADTTAIVDVDGLEEVVFRYQWLADDADIASATGATYTVVSRDVGKAIRVRVAFADDGGSEETLTSAPTVVTAAGLQLQSATVDGVTLTLTYSEVLDNGVTLGTTLFAVNVNGSPRSLSGVAVGGSNVLLLLSSAVEAGDTVTVDYTAPNGPDFIRDTLGRKAASFSGRAVTNDTAASGGGRSDPAEAPGAPDSLEVVRYESGKLRASWDAPDSDPAPTGYTVQWKESADSWADQDDVSEANVKETSHVITGLTDGVEYAVRVMARKGDAESTPSGEVAATPQETEPPAPSSASVDGATLTIIFDEPLDPGETPAKSAFAVTARDVGWGVETVAVSGSGVTITLAAAVCAGDAVSVGYTAPADASAVRLQDLAGNAAASFSEWQVTNNTGAAGQLTACARDVPASHDGSASFTFELRFSEEFSISYRTLRDHAFTVTGGEVVRAKRLERGKNVRWEISVRPDGNGAVTITLPVTTDCEDEGAICTGDARMLSNRVELTVGGPDG